MTITGALYTGSSALDAFSDSMAVTGDNIANFNTVGYKPSGIEFADLFPTVWGELEIGHGVRVAAVDLSFQQGALETTQQATDLAIEGQGFFVLRDAAGSTYYSRAGEFHFDASGNLVNPQDLFVQGAAGNINLANGLTLPAQATTSLGLVFNLDAAATVPSTPFPIGPDAPPSEWYAASNASFVTTVYDSLGAGHDLTFLFRKTSPNSWDYRVVAPRSELDSGAPNSADLREVSGGGTVAFNADGSLNAGASTLSDVAALTWTNGAASQAVAAANLSFAGSTQYAQVSSLHSLASDGFSAGALARIVIDSQGIISGIYSNGVSRVVGDLVLANFNNVDDLDRIGDTLLLPTIESGAARTGAPGQNEFGTVASGSLELSTVDLATEFVALLMAQRSFQVNSRVITTADRMYEVAANLKL